MAIGVESTDSEIVSYYSGKTVFITGGTGFIGRILVEHLIRKCRVKKIYMLVRKKKGVDPKERKCTIFNVPLFDKLRAVKPDFMDSIEIVTGDMSDAELGIDEASRGVLVNEVQIVFHSAATVNIMANLKTATIINVKGTREICRLCTKFNNLEAFVHVSTAYAHSVRDRTDETIYDVPIQPDDLIRIAESLTREQIEGITKQLLSGWQNTYTFTKAVAENIVKSYMQRIPMCVVRPGLVITTRSDPIEGWADNIYGPLGFIVGTASGVLRVSNSDPHAKSELVPADMVVSLIIAAGHHTGTQKMQSDVPIYNFVTDPDNPITYKEFNDIAINFGHANPPSYAIWYFTHTSIKNRFLYLMAMFWAHLVPAFIVDGFLLLSGRQPRAMKMYNKAHAFLDCVTFVGLRSWDFGVENTSRLRESLNDTDRKLFDFDMSKSNIDWTEMMQTAANGVSLYLLKEELLKSTAASKRKYFWLTICHRIVQVLFLFVVYWLLKITFHSSVYLFSTGLGIARYTVCPS